MKKLIYSQEDLDLMLSLKLQEKGEKLDQYKNNWEELKKWIKHISKYSYDDNGTFGDVLDKMKELEEES